MIRRVPARRAGFTLIEVMAAMLVFAAGVIMMLSLTRGLARSLERSAVTSVITAAGQQRVDSLSAVAYASLTIGTKTDTLTVRSAKFARVQTVSQYSPLVKRVIVSIAPLGGGAGATFSATSYVADAW